MSDFELDPDPILISFDWSGYKVYGLAFAIPLIVIFIIWTILVHKIFGWHVFLIAKYEIAHRMGKEKSSGAVGFVNFLWWIFFSLPFVISIAWGVVTAVLFKPLTFGLSIAGGLPGLVVLFYGFQNYKANGYRLSPAVRYPLSIAFIILAGIYIACVETFRNRSWMAEGYLYLWPPLLFYAFAISRCRRKFSYMKLKTVYKDDDHKTQFINDLEDDQFDNWIEGKGYMTYGWAIVTFLVSIVFNIIFIFLWWTKDQLQASLGTGVASFIIDFLILLSQMNVTNNSSTLPLLFAGYIIKIIIISFSFNYWFIGHGFLFLLLATYYIVRFVNWVLLFISKKMGHSSIDESKLEGISVPCRELIGKMNPEYKRPRTKEAVLTLVCLILLVVAAACEVILFDTKNLKILPFHGDFTQREGYILLMIFSVVLGFSLAGLISVKRDNFKCKIPMTVVFVASIILGGVFFYMYNGFKDQRDFRLLFYLVFYYIFGTLMVAFVFIGNNYSLKGPGGFKSLQTLQLWFYILCLVADAVCMIAFPYLFDSAIEKLGLIIFLCLTAVYLWLGFCFSWLYEQCFNKVAISCLVFYILTLAGICASGYKKDIPYTSIVAAVILVLSLYGFALGWTSKKQWRFDVGPTVIVCVISALLIIGAAVYYIKVEGLDVLCLIVGLLASTIFFSAIAYHVIQKNEYKVTVGSIIASILMIICIIVDIAGIAYQTRSVYVVISAICAIITLISYVGIIGFVLTGSETNVIVFTDIFLPVRRLFNGVLYNMGFVRTFTVLAFIIPYVWGMITLAFLNDTWRQLGSLGASASFAVIFFLAFTLMYNVDSMALNSIEHMEFKPIEFAVNKAIQISGCDVDDDLVVEKDESTYEKFMAYHKSRVQLFKDQNEFEAALKAQLYITASMQFLSDLEKARRFVDEHKIEVPFLNQKYFSNEEKKLIMKFIDAVEVNDKALEKKEDMDYDEFVRKQEKARAKNLLSFIQKPVKQLDEYGKLVQQMMQGNVKFADPKFHPLASITEENKNLLANSEFKRAEDVYKGTVTGTVNANEICQGALGDCYLVSAMASICSSPADVIDIFEEQSKITTIGGACISFYSMGKRHHVIVDTQLPFSTRSGKARFVKPRDDDKSCWWFTLVEKAYAKQNGSYSAIEGGNSHLALYRLVGGWPELFNLDSLEMKERINNGTFWKNMVQWRADKDYLCCGSHPGSDTTKSKTNIVQGHAYSILQVVEVKGFQLLQLRNPWGDSEWNGDWSDKSPLWDKHPDIAKQLGHTDVDDGMFWISFKDFCQNYSTVYVTLRLKNWHTADFMGKFEPGPLDGAKPVTKAPGAENVTQYTFKFRSACTVKVMIEKVGPSCPFWLYAVYNKGQQVKKILKGMTYYSEPIAPSALVESFEFNVAADQVDYPWTIFPVRNKCDKEHHFMLKVFATNYIDGTTEIKPGEQAPPPAAAPAAQVPAQAAAKDAVQHKHKRKSSSESIDSGSGESFSSN